MALQARFEISLLAAEKLLSLSKKGKMTVTADESRVSNMKSHAPPYSLDIHKKLTNGWPLPPTPGATIMDISVTTATGKL